VSQEHEKALKKLVASGTPAALLAYMKTHSGDEAPLLEPSRVLLELTFAAKDRPDLVEAVSGAGSHLKDAS
jgi:hypothetical protein